MLKDKILNYLESQKKDMYNKYKSFGMHENGGYSGAVSLTDFCEERIKSVFINIDGYISGDFILIKEQQGAYPSYSIVAPYKELTTENLEEEFYLYQGVSNGYTVECIHGYETFFAVDISHFSDIKEGYLCSLIIRAMEIELYRINGEVVVKPLMKMVKRFEFEQADWEPVESTVKNKIMLHGDKGMRLHSLITISEIFKKIASSSEHEGKKYIEKLMKDKKVFCKYEKEYNHYIFSNGYIAFVQEKHNGMWIAEENGHFCIGI